eukprot:6492253-Amphidinium_carterae.1
MLRSTWSCTAYKSVNANNYSHKETRLTRLRSPRVHMPIVDKNTPGGRLSLQLLTADFAELVAGSADFPLHLVWSSLLITLYLDRIRVEQQRLCCKS